MGPKVTRDRPRRESRNAKSQGPPGGAVLLLPGMSLNATIFPALALPTIAVEFHDVVLGPAGDGSVLRTHGMALYARLLQDALAAAPHWQDARPRLVVAHSFGGMLALCWLLTYHGHPLSRIDGLVLVATTAGPMYDRVRLRLPAWGNEGVRLPIAPIVRQWNSPLLTRVIKRLLSDGDLDARRVNFRRLSDKRDLALDLAGWRNTDWRAMRSYRLAMMGFDVRHRLPEIAVPTIVVHGTHDSLFPLEVAQELAAGLPEAELRVVAGAGHGLPLTHGREVQRAVGDLAGET